MKCPHCGKKVDIDPKTAEGLLLHIKYQASAIKKLLDRRIKLGCREELLGKKRQMYNKWQAWADWVETRIQERDSKKGDAIQPPDTKDN